MDDVDLQAIAEHLDDEQIIELVLAIAMANWTNRVNEGLRTPLPS
jgi:alkylhydroperoxidase family enzyme